VALTSELTFKVIQLEDELRRERKLLEREQREADDLRAELGLPKLHKRLSSEPILKDVPPEEEEKPICNRNVSSIMSYFKSFLVWCELGVFAGLLL